ncbi:YtxH domain-containing protein [Bacillus sp. 1NLA3E]|uniref:YtxH domain-containing protein n=1 Tax=Bacillus sp. 1NLA3E TaxID=666686 RepID=UPI000247ECD0|nr:YtxH domain-containing protein [Bacillus sp. 1NLA3E]AGK55708.1 hypothetical protein B1NLA3E_19820 [Bacillus sp. 1NLA3E]
MELIKIHTSKIRDISVSIIQNSNTIKESKSGFVSVKGSIDHRILSRRNIGSRLGSVSSSFSNIEQDLKQLGSFLENAGDIYNQTENTLEKLAKVKFPEGNSWELVKSFTGGVSFYQGTKINFQLGDFKFKFVKENGRTFIKLVGGNPRDYQRYRDLLIERFGGNPSLWKKGFYKNLITRGIPLYDENNNFNFNNSSGYRENIRRFGSSQLDDMSNYVSHLGDSKVKVFFKTAVDSVVGTVTDFNVFDYKSVTKATSKGLGVVGTGITVVENFQGAYDNNGFDTKKFAIDTTVDVVSGAGATAAGAAFGSLFVPPLGTVAGAAVGAGINFLINMKILPGEKSIVDFTKDFANDPEDTTKKITKEIEESVNTISKNIDNMANNIGKKLNDVLW